MENKEERGIGAKVGSLIGIVVLVAASVTGGWIACSMWPKGQQKGPMMQMPPATVAVRAVEKRPYNLPERYVAHAEAIQEVDLLPQVDGYIKEIKFKEGDLVKAGQLLYVLDDERYQAVVNQRKADLAAAEAEARRAERYWERMQKADARGITQKERDDAEAGAEKTKAAVFQAKANLVVAEYDLKKAQVFAPISGQIGKTTAHLGDYVAPSKGALARIVQVDPIRVSFPLTDRAYVGWRAAQKKGGSEKAHRMRLLLPDGSVYAEKGSWDFDDNQMSRETATIMMRLAFPNPDRLLVPNSYVTLLADYEKPPMVPCVPQQAVIDLPGGNQGVYILKDDMTVEQRPVETKETHAGWTPILSGVNEGEKVIVSGTSKLRPGTKVVLMEATANDDLDPKYKAKIAE
ncbi:MAG: efflux RND transporter periplasmic adaptor subunit [Kiritimatiellae bacterium]|nr:efflux RND transporter periplasmic adaptor subunit [Kiritimatiellia bacterium]